MIPDTKWVLTLIPDGSLNRKLDNRMDHCIVEIWIWSGRIVWVFKWSNLTIAQTLWCHPGFNSGTSKAGFNQSKCLNVMNRYKFQCSTLRIIIFSSEKMQYKLKFMSCYLLKKALFKFNIFHFFKTNKYWLFLDLENWKVSFKNDQLCLQ